MSATDNSKPRLRVKILLAAVSGVVAGAVKAGVQWVIDNFTDN
ncbi:hypothetical protein FB565_000200 [Actinoplanes lutulentus]|uniref:Uncharacterized protein n=1 Tax=Actinoplanes lutulentus TaxID=1287878 RepID=A0A327YW49_9ACTN|nr:hypothetical protein [Actinoplanes lutulentus]MBB2940496.1 hypothetical protein [Actinoplanes lutulentus]RAK25478.1 hypothetical protein B0I29_13317 [Actinoplanes lutulentus]